MTAESITTTPTGQAEVTDHALCFFAAVRCDVCGGGGE